MLLQSIKLQNFRQFKNEKVVFSIDPEKNVTIIKGDNGTGKTTLAQAFKWCLYGKTDFAKDDNMVLNKEVGLMLVPGEEADVKIMLNLRHSNIDYMIVRGLKFKKSYDNKILAGNSKLSVSKKDEDGNWQYMNKYEEEEVLKIIPEPLYQYFFFAGEKIEEMSREIGTGTRSTNFVNAVSGLTGLKALQLAMEHLKPTRANTVYGAFNAAYAGNSKASIDKLTKEINTLDDELEKIEAQLEVCKEKKEGAETSLRQFKEGERLQGLLKKYEHEKNQLIRNRSNQFSYIGNDFNEGKLNTRFFALSLVNSAIKLLSQSDFSGKDIPDMHARTIQYLLKRGICLCGTHLDEGSVPYNNLKELLNFLPPMSIGVSISNFIKETKSNYNHEVNLKEKLESKISVLSSFDEDIDLKQQDIDDVQRKLGGNDVSQQVKKLNEKILACKGTVRVCDKENSELQQLKGWKSKKREENDRERKRLSLMDKQNAQIETYKAYTQALYDKFAYEYKTRENETRTKLQKYINQNFQTLFDGGIHLTINEKYNVKVTTTNDVSFQTSTAQSIAVIFAFISAIIMIQREHYTNNDVTYAEPYPLVMDAPLSALDKTRIKAICETLPKIAEQIIVFIKDTDGEIAEEHLGNKIGKKYSFHKEDNFNTRIV